MEPINDPNKLADRRSPLQGRFSAFSKRILSPWVLLCPEEATLFGTTRCRDHSDANLQFNEGEGLEKKNTYVSGRDGKIV